MGKSLDLTGKRFTRLLALYADPDKKGRWIFRCDCGTEKSIRLTMVTSENTKSCGCLRKEVISKIKTTHGHLKGRKKSKTFMAFNSARWRCTSPKSPKWENYGGRGITFHDSWVHSFDQFLKDMGECPEGMTLERIDNEKGYEPGNCRWASYYDQSRNKRTNRIVSYMGNDMIFADFCEMRRVNKRSMAYKVLYQGMSPIAAADDLERKGLAVY